MRKALVIAPNWIGDALMAQPLFALIKARHPRLMIDALAPKWVAPVLARMPEISKVFPSDLAHGKLQLSARLMFAQQLKHEGYDVAYVLPNSLKSALIPFLAGIPLRIGYRGEARFGMLNIRHANPPRDNRPPMVEHYARLALKPGARLPESIPDPRLKVDPARMAATAERFGIAPGTRLIAFCPGAEFGPAKRWPAAHFAALAQMLRRSYPYAQMVTLGSAKDAEIADEIVQGAPFVRNLCGQTSLDDAVDLLALSEAAVCNDSGLMHVTAALNRPQVAVFGSSDPRHTPPLSQAASIMWLQLECSPCFKRECPLGHLRCLKEIEPEMVFVELRKLLHRP
ncbi:lipopolysaccharide heptosyltransferase II [Cupriavidus pauculus]|jgi:heptosyltransferase-2|uniref:lipopolysaccharide heptosyltransferase II n=1 Tax=Cupriavidus pauculus TaxID=82633 RepID=UPI0012457D58|nr:lipopolysaccharide heptosyltransferase II [Cupriavidus pauculus]KAB0603133.1 lipopolysaccharide heptosyltransferase II [Cupriavidus pauculus]MCM3604622.1 lipopolysaccharide heptosyltransferase II [Cupriavidus pauculus]UAK98666.1 lipopolysaccharide heptosyltransferase II [Cupriavidus pauculus]